VTDETQLQRIVLERLRFGAQQAISQETAHSLGVEVVANKVAQTLIVNVCGTLLAEWLGDHTESASERVPAGWWDHWKADHPRLVAWWRKWAWRRLREPRMRTVTLTTVWTDFATFPHSTYVVPSSQLGPVVFHRQVATDCEWLDD
jgi:hypothetical protein